MREVELSLNGTLREIFSFGESRGAFDRFLPSMCVMADAPDAPFFSICDHM